MTNNEIFKRSREACKTLALLSDAQRNEVLQAVGDAIVAQQATLLQANALDLAVMDPANPLYDRLQLTAQRLEGIAADMRHVSELPSPLGRTLQDRTLPNGLRLRRVSVPFGVIGVIYEARPNVTFDVFSLCFKSGNACVLKGGKDADHSNRAAIQLIHGVLEQKGITPDAVALLPATHEATAELLNAVGYIDVCIPRGGRKLIDFVRNQAHIPVIETGAGVVHAYFDASADLVMGQRIIENAKTRRVSVCNALDCLIVHRSRLHDLPELVKPLIAKHVELWSEEPLPGVNSHLACDNAAEVFGTEFMDYKMAIKVVDSIDEALQHIAHYGSGHSECGRSLRVCQCSHQFY